MISVKNIYKQFETVQVLKGVNCEIEKGEKEREDKIKAKEEEIQQLENEKTEIEKQIKELIFD